MEPEFLSRVGLGTEEWSIGPERAGVTNSLSDLTRHEDSGEEGVGVVPGRVVEGPYESKGPGRSPLPV